MREVESPHFMMICAGSTLANDGQDMDGIVLGKK